MLQANYKILLCKNIFRFYAYMYKSIPLNEQEVIQDQFFKWCLMSLNSEFSFFLD